MGLLYSSGDDLSQPHTHVLAIGVGAYDYMCPPGQAAPANPGGSRELVLMEQLTSPPVSANAFADWVLALKAADAWCNPLGTLRVLAGGPGYCVPGEAPIGASARSADIHLDVDDWKEDLARNPKNVGIFYFCGHGESQAGQSFVLPQDFGARGQTFWRLAINITEFVDRMTTVGCRNQLYFIDACRVSTPTWTRFGPSDGDPLIDDGTPILPSKPPIVFASPPSKPAFGEGNKVSLFTSALLETLDGYVAFRRSAAAPWMATQRSIVETVRDVGNLKLGADMVTPDGFPAGTDPIFHVATEKVYGLLCAEPQHLPCTVLRQSLPPAVLRDAISPISFDTCFGDHTFEYNGNIHNDFAYPPVFEVNLQ